MSILLSLLFTFSCASWKSEFNCNSVSPKLLANKEPTERGRVVVRLPKGKLLPHKRLEMQSLGFRREIHFVYSRLGALPHRAKGSLTYVRSRCYGCIAVYSTLGLAYLMFPSTRGLPEREHILNECKSRTWFGCEGIRVVHESLPTLDNGFFRSRLWIP